MAVNQFLPFGTGGGADVLSAAAWSALAARTAGFSTGTAVSTQLNSAWRQGSFGTAALGELIKANGVDALDDGNLATFVANLLAAMSNQITPRMPPGALLMMFEDVAPAGRFVLAQGQVVAQAGTYAALFAVIGTTYNTGGEGAGNFRLPDGRGMFFRGKDAGRGVDPSRAYSPTPQDSQNKAHYHLLPQVGDSSCINQYLYGATDISPTSIATLDNKSANTSDAARTSNGAESGGTEARPVNMAVRVYIAY